MSNDEELLLVFLDKNRMEKSYGMSRESVLKLMALAREDEREVCIGEVKVFYKRQIDEAFDKGKQAERERIDAILLKLKENMELAGYKEGWEEALAKDYCKGIPTEYRKGQFSVFEWLKREVRR